MYSGCYENQLQLTNWYLINSSPSENTKEFKHEILLTKGERALVLLTNSEGDYLRMLKGMENYSIRINIENEYEFQGSAQSVNKKEFIFMKKGKQKSIGRFIRKTTIQSKTEIKQFLKELTILRRLNHQNIMHFQTLYEEEKFFIMVFDRFHENSEYISLSLFLKATNLIEEIPGLQLAENLIDALDYLHSKEWVLHNFVKEENILISVLNGSITASLFNFFYARTLNEYKAFSTDLDLSTYPGYVSPELLQSSSEEKVMVGKANDIFALGCVLVKTMTGVSVSDLIQNDYKIPEANKTHLSRCTAKILESLVSKNPKERMDLKKAKTLVNQTASQLLGFRIPEFQLVNNRIKANIRTLSSVSLHSGLGFNTKLLQGTQGIASINLETITQTFQPFKENDSKDPFWCSLIIPSIIQEDDTNNERSEAPKKHIEITPFIETENHCEGSELNSRVIKLNCSLQSIQNSIISNIGRENNDAPSPVFGNERGSRQSNFFPEAENETHPPAIPESPRSYSPSQQMRNLHRKTLEPKFFSYVNLISSKEKIQTKNNI